MKVTKMTRSEWECSRWRDLQGVTTLTETTGVGARVCIAPHRGEFRVMPSVEHKLFTIEIFKTHKEAMEFCREMKFIVEFEQTGGKP
jgi:hypothetical protein